MSEYSDFEMLEDMLRSTGTFVVSAGDSSYIRLSLLDITFWFSPIGNLVKVENERYETDYDE